MLKRLARMVVMIAVGVMVIFATLIHMGWNGNWRFSNGASMHSGSTSKAWEMCANLVEIRGHALDYMVEAGPSGLYQFLSVFKTPIESKNKLAHYLGAGNTVPVDNMDPKRWQQQAALNSIVVRRSMAAFDLANYANNVEECYSKHGTELASLNLN